MRRVDCRGATHLICRTTAKTDSRGRARPCRPRRSAHRLCRRWGERGSEARLGATREDGVGASGEDGVEASGEDGVEASHEARLGASREDRFEASREASREAC